MFKKLLVLSFFISLLFLIIFADRKAMRAVSQRENESISWWEVQSIDTMKFSRDLSREKLADKTFDQVIDDQVKKISQTGATHVAVATPYDEEFLPFLRRWVAAARKYNLNVWFRGNWAGWEQWFGYQPITREEHLQKTEEFILQNQDLFEDGDIFTACPECENGGPGDPRKTKDVFGHRQFLIKEYQATQKAFKFINKQVKSNFNSMNGDVAKLIMDKETTAKLDGLVVIDHYVADVDTLIKDIQNLAEQSQGKIVLGELGVPISDIHGQMTELQQARWLDEALTRITQVPQVIGLNYWVNLGSTTRLWNDDASPRQAAAVIASFYTPRVISGLVKDQAGRAVKGVKISSHEKSVFTDKGGEFQLPILSTDEPLNISSFGFKTQAVSLDQVNQPLTVTLVKEQETTFFKIRKLFFSLFRE